MPLTFTQKNHIILTKRGHPGREHHDFKDRGIGSLRDVQGLGFLGRNIPLGGWGLRPPFYPRVSRFHMGEEAL